MFWFSLQLLSQKFLIPGRMQPKIIINVHRSSCSLSYFNNNRHHLPPWVTSFDLFRHRRVAIVSWGVHDLFFLEVCSWGRVSGVWCCPFFQDGWSSFVCSDLTSCIPESHFNKTRIFLNFLDVLKKCSHTKFDENPCSGSQVVSCRRTDKHTERNYEANSPFSNFTKARKNHEVT